MSTPFIAPSLNESIIPQTAAEWVTNGDVVLQVNELGYETDTFKGKRGDGVSTYANLAYETLDGSPFTGDGIVALDSDTPDTTGIMPYVKVIAGETATGVGATSDIGTVGVAATGSFTFAENPVDGDVMPSINGTGQVLFSDNSKAFPYVLIGENIDATLANLAFALTLNKTTPGFTALAAANYAPYVPTFPISGGILLVTAAQIGTSGNSVTLGTDTANITRSAATLEDGVDEGFVVINNVTFTVVEDGNTNPYTIQQGATDAEYATNIADAVTAYSDETGCTCEATDVDLLFTANEEGAAGNDITMSTTDPNLTLDGNLTGGVTAENKLEQTTLNVVGQIGNGLVNIETDGGATVIAANSVRQLRFYGSDTQTITLPIVALLELGFSYFITNDSSDSITVNSSGADLIQTIEADSYALFVCIAISGTDETSWRVYSPSVDPLVYKGVIDCSGNPNYPAGNAGDTYRISVAGKIGGASGLEVQIGDYVICNTDGTVSGNQATVGAYWNIIQANITTAADVANVPAGNIAATNVQDAINELDTEKVGGNTTNNLGYLNVPQNSQSVAYELVLADSGKQIFHPSTDANDRQFTIPKNATVAFALGTVITFTNDSANDITVIIDTDTLRYVDVGAVTTITIPTDNMLTINKTTTTSWLASGSAGCTSS